MSSCQNTFVFVVVNLVLISFSCFTQELVRITLKTEESNQSLDRRQPDSWALPPPLPVCESGVSQSPYIQCFFYQGPLFFDVACEVICR